MAWRCLVILRWVPAAPDACVQLTHDRCSPSGPAVLRSCALPSRAPGKHPLSKVTAQGQPRAGVLVKALDRQDASSGWTDGWTDRWTRRQTQGLLPQWGESTAACSMLGCFCLLQGPGTAPLQFRVTRCPRVSHTVNTAVAWAPRPRRGGDQPGAHCLRRGRVGAGRP